MPINQYQVNSRYLNAPSKLLTVFSSVSYATPVGDKFLAQETTFAILQENGGKILLDAGN